MADPDLKEDHPFSHYTVKHRVIAWQVTRVERLERRRGRWRDAVEDSK